MLWSRYLIVTALAVATTTCTPSTALCDNFVVITRDLESEAFPAGTVIELRVFKQIKADGNTPGAIRAGSNFARGGQIGQPIIFTTSERRFTVEFTFTIDVDNSQLTQNAEKPDRTILLEFKRNGGNTAIVPFIAVGNVEERDGRIVATNIGIQRLNVAVPEPRPQDIIMCCSTEYRLPCCNSRGRFRLFCR